MAPTQLTMSVDALAPPTIAEPVREQQNGSRELLVWEFEPDRPLAHSGHGFAFQGHAATRKSSDPLKRAIDLAIGSLLLVAAAPVIAVVAMAVKLDSSGPVFVGQTRIGKGLRPFRLYKFRSMRPDATALQSQVRSFNDSSWPLFKMREDPRVTRVGRILRRFSADELPQLVNVVRGEMSLVGPRPPLPDELKVDFVRQAHRLRVVPGMTGLWQVSGRSDLDYTQMVRLDLQYMRMRSVLFDLVILLRTIPATVSGKGAY